MDQAIDLDPTRETNYLDLGRILIANQRFSVALEAANKAVEVAPHSAQAYQLKGLAEINLKLLTDAARSYARVVELDPGSSEAIINLALVQSAHGLTGEAQATFEQAIKRFPQDPKVYHEYGRTLLLPASASEHAAEARGLRLLEKALSLNEALPEAHFLLGNTALSKGDIESALHHLQRAAELDPSSSKVHYALSRAYRRLGRNEDVLKELKIFEQLKQKEDKANPNPIPGAMSRGNPQEEGKP
jgi:Flp pilus assembly protein TadD